eukprot:2214214-Rhodomonas_salina.1
MLLRRTGTDAVLCCYAKLVLTPCFAAIYSRSSTSTTPSASPSSGLVCYPLCLAQPLSNTHHIT